MRRKRKKMNTTADAEQPVVYLTEQIKSVAAGLCYMSETDAEILPFSGSRADTVTKENLLNQIGKPADSPVEERNFIEFFARLTEIKDWFGDEEKAATAKFSALKDLLEKNLKDLKVFKVGKIQIDIYVVGLDANGNLAGIQTKAVET
jgi:Nuclease A inhibitor-like protein